MNRYGDYGKNWGNTPADDNRRKQFITRQHGLPFWEQAFLLIG